MDLGLCGKKAAVIGGSRGLGREIALGLAREGASVGIVGLHGPALEETICAMGGSIDGHWAIQMDLMEEGAPTRLVAQIVEQNGTVDIVVHNLGGTLNISDSFCTIFDWRRVWRLNFEIAVELNALLIPPMQRRKWGRVIHVSSVAAVLSRGALPYCSVKAALNAYTRNIGCTVAPDNVVVTAVMPGVMGYQNGSWAEKDPGIVEDFLKNRIAARRFATPKEISEFVLFLASEHASFFFGSIIPIDGGSW